ncbi:hypothetical protein TRVL_05774 [Trypanosoma vivax]|nr:hypothetical protein TRVL_05774 [Trypanosoma vivax]
MVNNPLLPIHTNKRTTKKMLTVMLRYSGEREKGSATGCGRACTRVRIWGGETRNKVREVGEEWEHGHDLTGEMEQMKTPTTKVNGAKTQQSGNRAEKGHKKTHKDNV